MRTRRSRRWGSVLPRVVVVGLLSVLLTGCPWSEGESLLKAAARDAHDLPELSTSRYVPREIPGTAIHQLPPEAQVEEQIRTLAEPVGQMDAEDQWETVDEVCEYVALVEAGQSPESARDYVVQQLGGSYADREEFRELADRLQEADSGAEEAAILAHAALCKAAAVHRDG